MQEKFEKDESLLVTLVFVCGITNKFIHYKMVEAMNENTNIQIR